MSNVSSLRIQSLRRSPLCCLVLTATRQCWRLALGVMPALALMVVLACLPSLAAEVPEDNQDELAAFVAELLAATDEAAWRDLLETHSDQVTLDLTFLLRAYGMDFAARGEFDLALRANAICLEIAVRLKDRALEASCAREAAEIHIGRQDFAAAAAEAKVALAILEELEDADPEIRQMNEVGARIALGHALHGMCEYEAALEQYQQAYLMATTSLQFELGEADAWVGIGNIRHAWGQFDLAMDAYQEALRIYGEWGIAQPMAACFHNIGSLQRERGRHKEALENLAVALEIHSASGERPEEARTLNNIGSVYLALGRGEEAQASFQAALAIAEEVKLPAEGARALINLGNLYDSQKRFQDAYDHFDAAVAVFGWISDWLGQARALNNIAGLNARQGRYAEALEQYETVLAVAREIGAPVLEAAGLTNLGCIWLGQVREAQTPGGLDRAWLNFSQARQLAAQIGDPETMWRAAYGEGLAIEGLADGASGQRQREQWQAARLAYEQSIEAIEGMRFHLQETEFAESFLGVDDKYRVYEDLVGLLGKLGETGAALQYLQRARYAALTERLRLSAINTGDEALNALLARYEDLMRQREKLRSLLSQELAKPEAQRSSVRVENLGELSNAWDEEIHETWKAMNQIDPEISSLARLDPDRWVTSPQLLPPGAVLVQYLPAESQLLIFTTRRGGESKFVAVEVGRAELNSRVEQTRALLQAAEVNTLPQAVPLDRPLRELLARLYADLIKPIEADLEGGEVLVILPYGMLYYLPFSALVRETATDEMTFLIEEIPIAYLHELTTDGLGAAPSLIFETPSVWTAFANPDGTLPSAEQEVGNIVALLPEDRSKVFQGQQANLAAVFHLPERTGALHFATHGVLNLQDPNESYLVLADGRLRQSEIYGLGLEERGTRLAVLSACRSFLGQKQPGLEVLGLADAFIKSGAKAVLGSLWAVDAYSTSDLMVGFYESLLTGDGVSQAAALQQAQLALLQNPRYAHPYFWASFVLYGDWR